MRKFLPCALLPVFLAPLQTLAQSGPMTSSAEPFKLGTFEIQGVPTVCVVLRDQYLVALNAANQDLATNPIYPHIPMPVT
ncbi:MAG: hypothetical protein IIC60_12710 [Proteobacteria bacterium]|nr:hypothetical protein [Pseudomonadota bacterium]